MANGNGSVFSKWVILLAGSLAVLGIAGGIKNAVGQGKLETQVEMNKETLDRRAAAVRQIPVIANDIEHIKEELDDIKVDMETNKREILDAIRKK